MQKNSMHLHNVQGDQRKSLVPAYVILVLSFPCECTSPCLISCQKADTLLREISPGPELNRAAHFHRFLIFIIDMSGAHNVELQVTLPRTLPPGRTSHRVVLLPPGMLADIVSSTHQD